MGGAGGGAGGGSDACACVVRGVSQRARESGEAGDAEEGGKSADDPAPARLSARDAARQASTAPNPNPNANPNPNPSPDPSPDPDPNPYPKPSPNANQESTRLCCTVASMLTHPSQAEAQSYAVFSGIAHKQVRG